MTQENEVRPVLSGQMTAFLTGGPFGTLVAMWLNDRLFIAANAEPAIGK